MISAGQSYDHSSDGGASRPCAGAGSRSIGLWLFVRVILAGRLSALSGLSAVGNRAIAVNAAERSWRGGVVVSADPVPWVFFGNPGSGRIC